MVMVPERLRELGDDELAVVDLDLDRMLHAPEAPAPKPAPRAASTVGALLSSTRRSSSLSGAWTSVIAGAWLIGLPLIVAVEPAPADPDAALPLWAVAMSLLSLVALGGLVGAALRRSRTAIGWSGASVVLLAAGVAACPLSAHHVGVGGWWAAQVAVTAAIGAVTVAAARRA